jgi:glucose-6-phosphate 1-dehydrogenase
VLFRDTPVEKLTPNLLVIHIQPDEGISLSFGAKIPGAHVRLGDVKMDFRYADYFGTEPSTGYERLLYDCMIGDATLFQRADMVEAGWAVVEPVLDVWKALPARMFPNYAAGSWGPKEAEDLIRRDGRRWRVELMRPGLAIASWESARDSSDRLQQPASPPSPVSVLGRVASPALRRA